MFYQFYSRAGYPASVIGDTLVVEPEPPKTPTSFRVVLPCDVATVSIVAAVAAVALPLGSHAVLGVDCPWMVEHDFTPLIEAITQLGARIWRGGSSSAILVVEPTAGLRTTYRSLIRLVGVIPGYVVAALLVALAWIPRRSYLVITGDVEARARPRLAAAVLRDVGAVVDEINGGRGYAVEAPSRPIDYVVPGGYAESITLAMLGLRGRFTIEGLPRELGGEEELVGTIASYGLQLSRSCVGRVCSLRIHSLEPRTGTVSAREDPEVATIAVSALLGLRPQSAIVAGLSPLTREGVGVDYIEELLRVGGAEAIAEEDRVAVLGWREEDVKPTKLECRPGGERQCIAAGLGILARYGRVEMVLGRDPDEVFPGLATSLTQLGVEVRVRKIGS
jgi:hypothetical protein